MTRRFDVSIIVPLVAKVGDLEALVEKYGAILGELGKTFEFIFILGPQHRPLAAICRTFAGGPRSRSPSWPYLHPFTRPRRWRQVSTGQPET